MGRDSKLGSEFFSRDVLEVAPALPGKFLCTGKDNCLIERYMITEVEAYRGEEDKACHVSRGRTGRTEVMYQQGGLIYVYFIYGMYWMLNIVTAGEGTPQAVLLRGISGFNGPGKLSRHLKIDGSYYGEDISRSERIWIEDHGKEVDIAKGKRIGIDYAGAYWRDIEWRFYVR
ncbi:MAG: DNA-3-methyladenine glycosylase [Bacteroidales bacterium]|jgi:DNA-3-methyladenine glycosylase|nr:DNA-3-methyladenine glycosylase [Bacteroidales bacterium]